ncbi:hypothetical protein GFS31_24860 [Leptolyngbya sp. BL0902]|nr:hypothetical protein GFS31_24860 [Leptolyngbya sp. BL0902]
MGRAGIGRWNGHRGRRRDFRRGHFWQGHSWLNGLQTRCRQGQRCGHGSEG